MRKSRLLLDAAVGQVNVHHHHEMDGQCITVGSVTVMLVVMMLSQPDADIKVEI